ncbi:hypothetical protein [Flavobacterium sp.]|jgi:hypothetical protein|uniref:hypothetical protein n=1 Tax=Flavobacterium sp. TaxID=239 RepID=UPI0037C108C5
MKTVIEEFKDFVIENEQFQNIFGGRKISSDYTGVVSGTNGSGSSSTMDITLYNDAGQIIGHYCDQPDANFGGIKAIGTVVGTYQ